MAPRILRRLLKISPRMCLTKIGTASPLTLRRIWITIFMGGRSHPDGRVFADTGYWIALLNPRDDLHQKASATSRNYTPNQIVTSEMVLTEFLNSYSDYGPGLRQAAARAVVSLREMAQIVIVPQTGQLFE